MSNITRIIIDKLNESSEVKKPYGEKPQEGKSEKLHKGKTTSIPKEKSVGKFKIEKLQNVNKEAGAIYPNDTERLMDKIDSTEHSDKGNVAKTTGVKADRVIKYPFGDKPGKSDSKLIKEGAESDIGNKVVTFGGPGSDFGVLYDEDVDDWKQELKKRHIKVKDIDDNFTFTVEGKIKDIYDFYNNVVDNGSFGIDYNSVEEFANWAGLLECAGTNCKNKDLKEDYDNGTWKVFQEQIEQVLENAKASMEEDAFLDFIDGVVNLCQNYNGELNQYDFDECDKVKESGVPIPDSSVQECAGKECK